MSDHALCNDQGMALHAEGIKGLITCQAMDAP